MPITEQRIDAQDIAAFQRQLELKEREVDRYEYPDQPFGLGQIIPFQTRNMPQYTSYTYYIINGLGTFNLIKNYATNVGTVEMLVDEVNQKIYKWGSSYDYSDDDIRAWLANNLNISTEKIEVVREVKIQKMNDLVAFGEQEVGMPGFINHPASLFTYSPIDVDRSPTPLQVLQVLNDAFYSVITFTKNIEKPDTLLLPLSRWNILNSRLITTDTGGGMINKTILQHFMETNPYVKNIVGLTELEGDYLASKGMANQAMMIAYTRNPRKVRAKIFQPLTWMEPQRLGMDGWKRACKIKFGGIEFKRPYSCHKIVLPNP